MYFVRKVIRLNRSLCVVIPKDCAEYIGVEKGSHVILKRIQFKNNGAITIEKLSDTMKEAEIRDRGRKQE